MKINLNDKVRVRLTDEGRNRLRKQHFAFYHNWSVPPEYVPPTEVDGWSEWQLWDLMRQIGPLLYNGCSIPIETEMEVGDD